MRLIILLFIVFLVKTSLYGQCNDFEIYVETGPFCQGSTIDLNSEYILQTTNNPTFQWSVNDNVQSQSSSYTTSFFHNNLQLDSVKVNFKGEADQGNCILDSTFYVKIYPKPSIEFEVTNVACPSISGASQSDGEIIVTSNLSIGTVFIEDNSSTFPSYINSNDTISELSAGIYTFFLADNNDCNSDTVEVSITEPNPFTLTNTIIQSDNCGQGTGQIIFEGLSGGTRPYQFLNTMTNGVSNDLISLNDSIIVGLKGDSAYNISLVDSNGCNYSLAPAGSQFQILRFNNPKPATPLYNESYSFCIGDSLFFVDQDQSNQELVHRYSFINGNQLTVRESNAGNTFLTSQELINDSVFIQVVGEAESQGCFSVFTGVDLIQLDCNQNTQPTNAFNPNSSIVENQTFRIDLESYGLLNEPVFVLIYNRWGDIIKEFPNYDNESQAWDGTNMNNKDVPIGTYFYTLKIPEKNISTSGWVYLQR